jgi:Na+/proline symporter
MYIGVGIFLIVVGAILTFALNASTDVVNLGVIGWICMAAGLLAILLSLIVTRRATPGGYSARRVSHTDPATGTRVDEMDVDRDNRL